MTDSRLVGTSSSTRTLDERDLSVMRPAAAPKPRRPRKSADPALRQVTNGIVCFCGERFGEHQALEFMLHLRAEVGETLSWAERQKDIRRKSNRRLRADQEWRERDLARQRGYRLDPEFRAKEKARKSSPEYRERANVKRRNRSPEDRAKENMRRRERYAQRKQSPQ